MSDISKSPTTNGQQQYDRLLALPAMTTWTAARQQEHDADAAAYSAALAAVQAGLRSQHVPGDSRWSAARRSRRVEKHLKTMASAARKQARAAEALRTAYAGHVAHVAELPGQREAKREAKQLRRAGGRQAIGQIAAKSLHKTAAAHTAPADEQEAGAPAAAAPRGVNDLWQQGA
ncbi:hypothetical protein AB0L80_38710 [Streptomyces sp. NPDC052069]|uniref:hypothetical protein n=1 Tax=Streptomyces sp. NPDC052069 TaxID=3154650 RepID=UPI00341FEE29